MTALPPEPGTVPDLTLGIPDVDAPLDPPENDQELGDAAEAAEAADPEDV